MASSTATSTATTSTSTSTSAASTSTTTSARGGGGGVGRCWNYVVTAHKPTAVHFSSMANFTSPTDVNLIIVRSTRMEIFKVVEDGLAPLADVTLYGRVGLFKVFRPTGSKQDHLMICTEQYHLCVLSYNSIKREIQTEWTCNVRDRVGIPCQGGMLGAIDPNLRVAALLLYNGILKVIPMTRNMSSSISAYNLRLEEVNIIDIQFQYNTRVPTLVVLYQVPGDVRHVKTYELTAHDQNSDLEIVPGPWDLRNVESGTTMLIPVPSPLGGIIIVSEQTITYHNGQKPTSTPATGASSAASAAADHASYKALSMKPTTMVVYGKIDEDGKRILLGDEQGLLYVLTLERARSKLADIRLDTIGMVCAASTISYVDNGVVFVGSRFSDSKLIRLLSEKNASGDNFEVLDRFVNIGPTPDFVVVDLAKQGEGQLVTCSGAYRDCSLRVISNGVGVSERASFENLTGLRGLWSLRSSTEPQFDEFVVVSFVSATRILSFREEEISEFEIPGFDCSVQSMYCGNVVHGNFIQVTSGGIRLVSGTNYTLLSQWEPGKGTQIKVVSCNSQQVLLSTGDGNLFYLEIQANKIVQVSKTKMANEVSCVDVGVFGEAFSSIGVVGLWGDLSVHVLKIPSLDLVCMATLEETIARSVMYASMEGVSYVLCGMGDGTLCSFVLDTGQLKEKKKVRLASTPLSLNVYQHGTSVFVAADRPTLVYTSNGKLRFSNVNIKEVTHMCTLNTRLLPNSIALATEAGLKVGSVDDMQKLHIRTIPLEEMPRRIAYQEETKNFCVLTITNDDVDPVSYVRLINSETFDTIHKFELDAKEAGCSILSTKLPDESGSKPYFVVGTAYVDPDEVEPTKGRVLVFDCSHHTLELVCERQVKGAVYSLDSFVGGRIIASVNDKVKVLEWQTPQVSSSTSTSSSYHHSKALVNHCSCHTNVLALWLVSRGDIAIVGDLMKSMMVIGYKEVEQQLVELARDFNPNWLTAIEFLDEDTYLAAENSCNLFTLKTNSDSTSDDERQRLDVCGQFYLGEYVNKFRHGSLVMKLMDTNESPVLSTVLFCTVGGMVGVVASLSKETFDFFLTLQNKLTSVISGVGGILHSQWRSFSNERRTEEAYGFIDGDLIESFLDLSKEKMALVVQGMGVSVEEVCRRVEQIQRATH